MRHLHYTLIALVLALSLAACEQEQPMIYEVNDVQAQDALSDKSASKQNLELISNAHTDLLGSTIDNKQLTALTATMVAFGDQEVMVDLIIRNFLNDPDASVPPDDTMRNDPEAFVDASYEKFYLRQPTEYERWGMVNMINDDPELTVEEVYYAFLTSNEYRYY